MSTVALGVRTDARSLGSGASGAEGPPRPGMVRAGDSRSWVWPGALGGALGAGSSGGSPGGSPSDSGSGADPLAVVPRGTRGCRSLNAEVLQNPAIPADDVGLVTEATDDPFDMAHAEKDERDLLRCSRRVSRALCTARRYHRSLMVTRVRVREVPVGDRRVRAVERVERVSFETRECELAARERRLRDELGVELGWAVSDLGGSVARAGEL